MNENCQVKIMEWKTLKTLVILWILSVALYSKDFEFKQNEFYYFMFNSNF